MKKILPIVLIAAAVVIGLFLWRQVHIAEAPHNLPDNSPPVAASVPAASVPAAPEAPAIKFPIPGSEASAAQPLPKLAESDSYMAKAVAAILGSDFVSKHLRIDEFMRRCVATTDNLGRSYAPVELWPLKPTPGRFATLQTERKNGPVQETILPDNDNRYTELVKAVDAVDMHALAKLYFDTYPLFQEEYQELGFPKGYFNDRLVEVLDLLIATPEPTGPVEVHLVDVEGPIKPAHPWERYEYNDPKLQSLSSGQKILLRVGKTNRDILRRKLVEFRNLVAAKPAGK